MIPSRKPTTTENSVSPQESPTEKKMIFDSSDAAGGACGNANINGLNMEGS